MNDTDDIQDGTRACVYVTRVNQERETRQIDGTPLLRPGDIIAGTGYGLLHVDSIHRVPGDDRLFMNATRVRREVPPEIARREDRGTTLYLWASGSTPPLASFVPFPERVARYEVSIPRYRLRFRVDSQFGIVIDDINLGPMPAAVVLGHALEATRTGVGDVFVREVIYL